MSWSRAVDLPTQVVPSSRLWNWEGACLMSVLREAPEAASDPQAQVWAGKGPPGGDEAPHPLGLVLRSTAGCLCLQHLGVPSAMACPILSTQQ